LDFETQGTIIFNNTNNATETYTDFCYSETEVREFACSDDVPPNPSGYAGYFGENCSAINASYICVDGACVFEDQTGAVINITGWTDPDEGIIDFQAITEGNIDYVKFYINFNLGQWQDIGTDYTPPYIVSWSDNESRENVRIQVYPYYNEVEGYSRTEGPFQYLGPGNQTNFSID